MFIYLYLNRNTIRFLLGNLNDYDGQIIEPDKLTELDKWMILRTKTLQEQIKDDYLNYNFLDISSNSLLRSLKACENQVIFLIRPPSIPCCYFASFAQSRSLASSGCSLTFLAPCQNIRERVRCGLSLPLVSKNFAG